MDNSVKFKIELESNGKKVLSDLSINVNDFRKAVMGAVGQTRRLSEEISGMAGPAVVFSTMNAALEQLSGMTESVAAEFNSFDKSLRAVNTMAGKDAAGLKELKGQIEDLASQIPLAKDELASGLYQVISNGVPEDNWIDFLDRSAKSAVGGIADLGQTVTVTSTIIKNYGLGWSIAGEIQDKIQTTAKNGVTSFEQLAAALPRVTGNAATLGVSIDELMAAFATLTGVSGNTAEVSTQLAAVFTALVKPSSEAAEMAQQMGVQFDAAAIKAAGGMNGFLASLDMNIRQYAAAHGMLEQEIYGKLFGSAEALRALIPITGELRDTFVSNIDAMAESGGAIDAAFNEMAGSGESMGQIFRNNISTMTDWAGSIASAIQPQLSFIAQCGQAITGIILLGGGVKKTAAAIRTLIAAHKTNAVVSALSAAHTKVVALAQRMLTASTGTATVSTWALNTAVAALYATLTLGLSVVITGLVSLFSSLGHKAEEAGASVDDFQEATDAFKRSVSDTKAELDMEIASLAELIRSQKDAGDKVDALNSRYGEAFGQHKTAAEWYSVLVTKSKAYCMQLGYEAQAKVLASQIAAKQIEKEDKEGQLDWMGRQYMDKNGKSHYNWEQVKGGKKAYESIRNEVSQLDTEIRSSQKLYDSCISKMIANQNELADTTASTTQEVAWQTMSYNDLGKAIDKQKALVGSLAGTNEAAAKKEAETLRLMEKRYAVLGKDFGLASGGSKGGNTEFDGSKLIENADSYKALGNNITYYRNMLDRTSSSETEEIKRLSNLIKDCEDARDAIRKMEEAAGRPANLDTLEDIDAEIQYQQSLRRKATSDTIAGIDAEIVRLNGLKAALEDSAHTPVGIEQIKTFAQLDNEISYYENKLKTATETERAEIQKQINDLNRLKTEWNTTLNTLNAPGDISALNTFDALDNAISYYSDIQKTASAEEIADIQKTINALQNKRNAMMQLTQIPAMQDEIGKLDGLKDQSRQSLIMKLELIGIDGIKDKIRGLQSMLDNVENPLNEEQRAEVESLITSWEGYGDVLAKNQNQGQLVTGTLSGLSSLMGNLSRVVGEGAAGWLSYGANILSAVAQALPALASVIGGNIAQAFSGAAAQSQTVPFPLNIIALASSMAAVTAAVLSIPKFADGGIAYGPTLGIFGEYSGAATNPEVVAPLDKLRGLLTEPSVGNVFGKVQFEIKGRTLVGILNRENNIVKRS